MSYTLACNTGVFAAIGPDAATQLNPCRSPHPTSVMHIHGTADRLVPYSGGQGFSVINGPSAAGGRMRSGATSISAAPRPPRPAGLGHHVDRRMRRQPQRRARHGRRRRPRVAVLRYPDVVAVLRRASALSITPLVRLSKKCNIGGMPDTHVVTNQVPPLENHNPASSPVLVEALIREGGQWGLDEVNELGAISGSQRGPAVGRAGRPQPARSCTPTTATATASTRWSTTRPTTS